MNSIENMDSYLLAVFLQKKFKSAIDIGCTHGVMVAKLNNICPTLGVDISSGYIKKARKHFPKLKFKVTDIRTYKPKKRFDVAVTHGLLIHIPKEDIRTAIKNIFRIAKHGLFIESSAETNYASKRTEKYDPKKYWEQRAKYQKEELDLKMPYYIKHNYPMLFQELGLCFQVVATFDIQTNTRMYYVWRPDKLW